MSVACHLAFFEAESGHCVLDRFFVVVADKLSVAAGPGRAWCGHYVQRRRASAVIVSANSLHDTAACVRVLDPASAASHAVGLGAKPLKRCAVVSRLC